MLVPVAGLAVVAFVSVVAFVLLQERPDDAARGWMEAAAQANGAALTERTCDARQAEVRLTGGLLSFASMIAGGSTALGSIDQLTFITIRSDGTRADVRVTGPLSVSAFGFTQTQNVNEVLLMVHERGKWRYCGRGTS